MYVQNLDVTDPTALEAALEAAPLDTLARVVTAGGERLTVRRVPGGWDLPGDLAVASADVAAGEPRAVALLLREDYRGGSDGLAEYADIDPEDAASLRAWREARAWGEDPYDERDHTVAEDGYGRAPGGGGVAPREEGDGPTVAQDGYGPYDDGEGEA